MLNIRWQFYIFVFQAYLIDFSHAEPFQFEFDNYGKWHPEYVPSSPFYQRLKGTLLFTSRDAHNYVSKFHIYNISSAGDVD